MTEPKQSFTEEVQKEAEKYVTEWTEANDKLAQRRCRVDFLAGVDTAIKLLSGVGELQKYHVTKDSLNMTSQFVYREKDVVLALAKMESALVAERARNAELEAQNSALDKMYELQSEVRAKLESENAALKMDLEGTTLSEKHAVAELNKAVKEITTLRDQLSECKEHLESVIYGEPPDFATKFPAADKFIKDLELQKKGQGE